MIAVGTFASARASRSGVTALVPTMGFLHEGHLSLIATAAAEADTTLVSLFVNPLQFDEAADLDRYPTDHERDVRLAAEAGADVLFVPAPGEMYPENPVIRVGVGPLADELEGVHRQGHFEGVATVVAKLFAGLQPDRAHFGRKDAQQLAIVSRLAADLSFPIEVVGGSTVREEDGLALSSRNVFLTADARQSALSLSRGLLAAAAACDGGERSGTVLEGIVAAELERTTGVEIEYAALADAATASRIHRVDRPAFLAVAARAGAVRLIDNVWLGPDGVIDCGHWLDRPSVLYEERA